LTTIPDVDPEIYGTPVDISDLKTKEVMLNHFQPYLEANLKQINTGLQSVIT
jgi:hypothetical protein